MIFNRKNNVLASCLLFLSISGLTSCNKKETIYDVCNCQSTKIEIIKDEGGLIAKSVDSLKIISVRHGYITTCTDLPLELQKEGNLVIFSGRMISTCKKEHSGYAIWSTYLDITTISKIDTLYVNDIPQIEIVKTEDYGRPPGFGYIINDTKKQFKIEQLEIPGVVGTDPFKTYNDALKIAFLVAYKLENINDYPSVYLGELAFLEIQGQ